jgi:hypothetical protein
MRSKLSNRLSALERSLPKKEVIFVSWMREEGVEITEAKNGQQTWTRTTEETETEFRDRVKSEVTVRGPYPEFIFVS